MDEFSHPINVFVQQQQDEGGVFFKIKANQDKVMESHQPRHQYHLKR